MFSKHQSVGNVDKTLATENEVSGYSNASSNNEDGDEFKGTTQFFKARDIDLS